MNCQYVSFLEHKINLLLATAQGLPDSVGTQAHLSGLQTNPNMSLPKTYAYIDSTLKFFCPRI